MIRDPLDSGTVIHLIVDIPTLTVYRDGQRSHASAFNSEPGVNGGGVTRMLARGDRWRVSLAEVTDKATFSILPGVDRLFIPLLPDTIALRARIPLHEEPSGAVRFPGDEAISAAVPGGVALALNLMKDDPGCQMSVRRYPGCLSAAIAFPGR